MAYPFREIEIKWQQQWIVSKVFRATIDVSRPKYYVLDMFPYPSGAGLHVGHLMGYTATDTESRYRWMKGFQVLHPMGWDSFGLPAEQYAIRTGTHPEITTRSNIANYKRQLQSLGYAYDWDREVATSDPSYYRWTQWLFTKFYEKGLAYQAEMLVNYCPALGTVLANEEVENGVSKEGGYPIQRRPLKQWILRITAYAERLLADLDTLDWPEGLKKLQRNWIGKSEGASITFHTGKGSLAVFTTAPHTLFGVTFLAIAPEHPLLSQLVTEEHVEAVQDYQTMIQGKSDLDRTELSKEKTGVFTGTYASHPVTGAPIPVWVADYVLMPYGTGIIMGVPAHDSRDEEFAQRFALPVQLIMDETERMVHSAHENLDINGLTLPEAKERVICWLEEQGQGERKVLYKLRDWLFSRQRYWGEPFPLLHLEDGSIRALDLDELPLMPPEIAEYKPSDTGESPLARAQEWVHYMDPKSKQRARRETDTMPQWAGSCWYYLRFIDPSCMDAPWSAEADAYWMPVDLYVGGAEHAVLHLLYARFWHKVFYDCGWVHTKEPFQKLCNQGLVVSRSYKSPLTGKYVAPEQVEMVDDTYRDRETGEVLLSQIEKMSKSKLNGVSPDELLDEYGADAVRLYALFLGPLEKEKVWNSEAISGCRRFLQRFYDMVTSERVCEGQEGIELAHQLVDGVGHLLDRMHANTAIAKHMEFVNAMTARTTYPREGMKMAVLALAPLAPHLAEELWQFLGEKGFVAHAPWPQVNPLYLEQDQATYVIQINGKVRATIALPKDQSEQQVMEQAQALPGVQKYLISSIKKVVFVPNKLLNLVL